MLKTIKFALTSLWSAAGVKRWLLTLSSLLLLTIMLIVYLGSKRKNNSAVDWLDRYVVAVDAKAYAESIKVDQARSELKKKWSKR